LLPNHPLACLVGCKCRLAKPLFPMERTFVQLLPAKEGRECEKESSLKCILYICWPASAGFVFTASFSAKNVIARETARCTIAHVRLVEALSDFFRVAQLRQSGEGGRKGALWPEGRLPALLPILKANSWTLARMASLPGVHDLPFLGVSALRMWHRCPRLPGRDCEANSLPQTSGVGPWESLHEFATQHRSSISAAILGCIRTKTPLWHEPAALP
jgi:hypothetical protein